MMEGRMLADLSLDEFQVMASDAAANAVAESVARGLPVTGLLDGQVATLAADDARLSWAVERARKLGLLK